MPNNLKEKITALTLINEDGMALNISIDLDNEGVISMNIPDEWWFADNEVDDLCAALKKMAKASAE